MLVHGTKGKRRTFSDKEKFDEAVKRRKTRAHRLANKRIEKEQSKQNERLTKLKLNTSRSGPISPNGRWRAFIKNHDLFVHDLKDGADIQLSKDGTELDPYIQPFFWSPDSKYVGLMKRLEIKTRAVHYVDSAPDDQLQPKHFTRSYGKPGDPMPTQTVHVFLAGWNSCLLYTSPSPRA